jgi:hypothetical protein
MYLVRGPDGERQVCRPCVERCGFRRHDEGEFSWVNITRHTMVKGTASPDDPELKDYWERRIKAKAEGLPVKKQMIARNQDHKCWRCGEDLDNGEDLQMHRINPEEGYTVRNTRLVHYYCHQQITAEQYATGRLRGRARSRICREA